MHIFLQRYFRAYTKSHTLESKAERNGSLEGSPRNSPNNRQSCQFRTWIFKPITFFISMDERTYSLIAYSAPSEWCKSMRMIEILAHRFQCIFNHCHRRVGCVNVRLHWTRCYFEYETDHAYFVAVTTPRLKNLCPIRFCQPVKTSSNKLMAENVGLFSVTLRLSPLTLSLSLLPSLKISFPVSIALYDSQRR